MTTLRSLLTPLARRAALRAPTTSSTLQRRFLSSDAPILYSAHAKVVGARTGHVDGDDLHVDLTMSKALGGPGDKGKTNPEELFAAGYGACFQSAMNASALSMKQKLPADSVVEATVHLIGDLKALDMGLKVDLKIHVPEGMDRGQFEKIVEKAKEVCPYSRATKGNVETSVEIV